ncbi:Hypothetical protein FKW44_009506 [Caligus rogercresseyi]|uniref:Uncharacterized protein n=1 Tax=Caligus rogercresseyi TaxID=217165 RepID=A0A7T8K8C9_CALRO|nr:Hypothetical protein FKW44_009506 [Caligus rogercresseyi]
MTYGFLCRAQFGIDVMGSPRAFSSPLWDCSLGFGPLYSDKGMISPYISLE